MKKEDNKTIKNIFEPVLAKKKNRIAAYFIDIILFVIIFTGILFLMSFIVGFQKTLDLLHEAYKSFGLYVLNSSGEYELCVNGCVEQWNNFYNDSNAVSLLKQSYQLALLMFVLSAFVTSFIYDFIIPVFLKNGQTIGMKILKVGLLNNEKYKVTNLQLFIRFLFGKFLVNLLIPIFAVFYYLMTGGNIIALMLVISIPLINIIMVLMTKNENGIANTIGNVVAISMDETYIFETKNDYINAKCEQERLDEAKNKTWK